MYFLFAKQLRGSGLPADVLVLVGKLNKDISFTLRRGTIATSDYTCVPLTAAPAQRAVELESPALNRRARRSGIAGPLLLFHDGLLTFLLLT